MKNVIGLLVLAVMTTSCVNISGVLNVSQPLVAKKRGGFLNLQKKTTTIAPGSYSAELKVNTQSSFTLKLQPKKEGDSSVLIPLTKKDNTAFDLPSTGEVSIKGADVSQPFDLKGTIETNITYSDRTGEYQSCTFTRVENHCDKVCTQVVGDLQHPQGPGQQGPGSKPGPVPAPRVECHVICANVPVTYNGQQYVESHYRYTTRNLIANIVKENSVDVLATFSGSGSESDKIIDSTSQCR
jgi:hypothetical protein